MQTGEISFCNHIGFNIKSDEVKANILSDLKNNHNVKIIDRHYDKYIDASHSRFLESSNFLLSLRTNGNPYFLLLTKVNNVNQCIFIDKKIQNGYVYPRMVITKFFFDNELFDTQTLFDGEMVKTNNDKWIYIINDILVDRTLQKCSKSNLLTRLMRCYEILDALLRVEYQDICAFQIKRYFETNDMELLHTFKNNLEYTCRGIYFTSKGVVCKQRPFLMNFDDSLIKKKVKIMKSIDNFAQANDINDIKDDKDDKEKSPNVFKRHAVIQDDAKKCYLQKTSVTDIYDVFDEKNTNIGVAMVNSIKTSKRLKNDFLNATPIDKKPYMCVYNSVFTKWCPIV